MIPLIITVEMDDRMERLKPKPARRIFRSALKAAVEAWAVRFRPLHFERRAYQRYAGAYGPPERVTPTNPGLPLVESGALQRNLLRPVTQRDIRASGLSARLRLRYTTPDARTGAELKQLVLREFNKANARGRSISYPDAVRRASKYMQSYPTKARKEIQRRMSAVSGGEVAALQKVIRDVVTAELNKPGRKRRKKVR